jgi:adenosylhomocysteine nucleosidase
MKVFASLAALCCLSVTAQADPLDPTPRYAVMSAFEPEWIALQAVLGKDTEHVVNGNRYLTGTLGEKPVVLFLSGVSMVNAAMNAQVVLDRFNVQGIVFSGIAGGVDPGLSIGDVVVPAEWSEYLESVLARRTEDGFAMPPWMPPAELDNYGMFFPQPVGVVSDRQEGVEHRQWFPADPGFLATAEKVAGELDLAACNAENACLETPPKIVVGGTGVSGQSFVDNAEFREWVFDTFQARVLDMESAAVAHVAYANEVPFVAFRSLSDLAGGGEGANEMATFMSVAAANSAAVVEAFLKAVD